MERNKGGCELIVLCALGAPGINWGGSIYADLPRSSSALNSNNLHTIMELFRLEKASKITKFNL